MWDASQYAPHKYIVPGSQKPVRNKTLRTESDGGIRIFPVDIFIVKIYFPLIGGKRAVEDIQQRGFSRAVYAHERNKIAGIHQKWNIFQRLHVFIEKTYIVYGDDGIHRRPFLNEYHLNIKYISIIY